LWLHPVHGIANMVVEIPLGTRAKLEICKDEQFNPIKQDVKKDQLRYVAGDYPFNYGALPQTWENPMSVHAKTHARGDNDPIDAVEISRTQLVRGGVIQVKVLGCLAMIDEGETDWKIVCIDINHPLASKLQDINDVSVHFSDLLYRIYVFFRDYKIPDGKPPNKFAFDGQFQNKQFALDVINDAHADWIKLANGTASGKNIWISERTTENSLTLLEDTVRMLSTLLEEERKKNLDVQIRELKEEVRQLKSLLQNTTLFALATKPRKKASSPIAVEDQEPKSTPEYESVKKKKKVKSDDPSSPSKKKSTEKGAKTEVATPKKKSADSDPAKRKKKITPADVLVD